MIKLSGTSFNFDNIFNKSIYLLKNYMKIFIIIFLFNFCNGHDYRKSKMLSDNKNEVYIEIDFDYCQPFRELSEVLITKKNIKGIYNILSKNPLFSNEELSTAFYLIQNHEFNFDDKSYDYLLSYFMINLKMNHQEIENKKYLIESLSKKQIPDDISMLLSSFVYNEYLVGQEILNKFISTILLYNSKYLLLKNLNNKNYSNDINNLINEISCYTAKPKNLVKNNFYDFYLKTKYHSENYFRSIYEITFKNAVNIDSWIFKGKEYDLYIDKIEITKESILWHLPLFGSFISCFGSIIHITKDINILKKIGVFRLIGAIMLDFYIYRYINKIKKRIIQPLDITAFMYAGLANLLIILDLLLLIIINFRY